MTELIAPTLSAVTADTPTYFHTTNGQTLTISADALAGAEVIPIKYSANGKTWKPAQNVDGDITLTATRHQAVMRGAGLYRVEKPATASACGVYALT